MVLIYQVQLNLLYQAQPTISTSNIPSRYPEKSERILDRTLQVPGRGSGVELRLHGAIGVGDQLSLS